MANVRVVLDPAAPSARRWCARERLEEVRSMGALLGIPGMRGWLPVFSDTELERDFQVDQAGRELPFVRAVLVLGAFLQALAASLLEAGRSSVLVAPLLLATALLLGGSHGSAVLRRVVPLVVVLAGVDVVTRLAGSDSSQHAAAVLVLFFVPAALPGRFFATCTVASLMVGAALAVHVLHLDGPGPWWTEETLLPAAAGALAMATSLAAEVRARRAFIRLRRAESERRSLENINEVLADISMRDPLTNLLNRRQLERQLAEAVTLYRRMGLPTSLVMIDLDGFKHVNDTFGHIVGDELLACVARTLRSSVRTEDLVFRTGGDEFCVLLPNTSLEAATRVGNDLLAILQDTPMPSHQCDVRIGFSAGIAMLSGETSEPLDLLREADGLLYRAKRSGRGRVVSSGDLPVIVSP